MDIHTGDEIEDVHHMLQSVTHDSCQATAKLTQALKNIQERDEMLTEALARAQEASAAKTANAFEEDVKQCLEAGMNAHLSKPVDIDQLTKLLGRVLTERNR